MKRYKHNKFEWYAIESEEKAGEFNLTEKTGNIYPVIGKVSEKVLQNSADWTLDTKPMFKAFEGTEILEGDEFYVVYADPNKPNEVDSYKVFGPHTAKLTSPEAFASKNFVFFNGKQQAIHWITVNKPILSLTDLHTTGALSMYSEEFRKLKCFVIEKIGKIDATK